MSHKMIARTLGFIVLVLAATSGSWADGDIVIANPQIALPPGVSVAENSLVLAAGAMAYVTDYCPGIEGRYKVLEARAQELGIDLGVALGSKAVARVITLTKLYGAGRDPAVCYRIYELYGPKGDLIPRMIGRK